MYEISAALDAKNLESAFKQSNEAKNIKYTNPIIKCR